MVVLRGNGGKAELALPRKVRRLVLHCELAVVVDLVEAGLRLIRTSVKP